MREVKKRWLVGGLLIASVIYYSWSYQKKKQLCKECLSNSVTATLHYQEEWNKYFLLNCYCDDPKVLREICQLAKQVSINDADTITSYSFVQFPFYQKESGAEVEDWEEINFNNTVAGFSFYQANRKLLDGIGFKPTSILEAAKFFKSDSLYKSRKDTLTVTYKASYEKINGPILNVFIKQAKMNKAREKFRFCNYDLYNTTTQRVESSIRYVEYGKGFYFNIW